jgi:Apea-like HEPN
MLADRATSDEIGIGKLISNRFAYLVATSHEQRTSFAQRFSKIYQVRSQIVHSGKHQLSIEERLLFSDLRWMCRSALSKEMDLLKAAQEERSAT